MVRLKVVVLGKGLVAAGVSERIGECGHDLVAFLDCAAHPLENLSHGLANAAIEANLLLHPHDLLLSVGTPYVLKEHVRSISRLAAINFHNSILPAYAGLNATAWAIYNGEQQHGISWHHMVDKIDAGAILVQRRFTVHAEDTARSLDIRCSKAAIESVDEVLRLVAQGTMVGTPQESGGGGYFGKRDTVPNGGEINWRCSAQQIDRLVRACDGGKDKSGFGVAGVRTPSGFRRVKTGRVIPGSGAAGDVLEVRSDIIVVACIDGAIELVLDRPAGVLIGVNLCPNVPSSQPLIQEARRRTVRAMGAKAVPARISTAAMRRPNAVAIVEGDQDVSWEILLQRSHTIATELVGSGLTIGSGVGVLLSAGADFVVAALGAMQAGGAYVPLDPDAPLARRSVEVAEAGISHIVTSLEFAPLVESIDAVVLLVNGKFFENCGAELPNIRGDHCAYRIFTSGSTGTPKAVEITHAALNNLVDHVCSALPFSHDDRMTLLSAMTFDASVFDIWPILVAGGTLLIPPKQILLEPRGLIEWLSVTRATCASVPTAIAERIIAMDWPPNSELRTLITGGDALRRRPPAGLSFKLINSYGPTENTVSSLWSTVGPGVGIPPIGHAITGVTAVIIDAEGQRLPDGEVGEIALGGVQVALGYRGRDDLTRERFEPDPDRPGWNRYRTGDTGYVDEKGTYHFCGRIDNQVQVLGRRIELEELEALLMNDIRVEQAVCVPVRKNATVVAIDAHIILARHQAEKTTVGDIRTALSQRLAKAVLPRRFVVHESLPMTVAGKVDRKAIGQLEVYASGESEEIKESDGSLDDIWWRTLGLAKGNYEDSFWDLGGDSLAAIDMLLEVERVTGVRISIGTFFADPTLAGIQRSIQHIGQVEVIRLRTGSRPPLILWYGYSGDLEVYRHFVEAISDREVLGIVSPALGDLLQAPASIEVAAERALAALKNFGVVGPLHFVGYSWAGLVAFEAARQLTEIDEPPALVGLIGSIPPEITKRSISPLSGSIQRIPRFAWRVFSGQQKLPWSRSVDKSNRSPGRNEDIKRTGALDQLHLKLVRSYNPTISSVVPNIMLFRESSSRDYVSLSGRIRHEIDDYGWSLWAGKDVAVYWLDADHSTIMHGASAAKMASALVDVALQFATLSAVDETPKC